MQVRRIDLIGNCDIAIPLRVNWADFNQDGLVNAADQIAYGAAHAAGATAADLTVDGVIDAADASVFHRIYAAATGGPP